MHDFNTTLRGTLELTLRASPENPQFVEKCRMPDCAGGHVNFWPRTAIQGPHVSCEGCGRDYSFLRQTHGWIDLKLREDEQLEADVLWIAIAEHLDEGVQQAIRLRRDGDLGRYRAADFLLNLTDEELAELDSTKWFGDLENVVFSCRKSMREREEMHEKFMDLNRALARACRGENGTVQA